MIDAKFTKPNVVQDFEWGIAPEDIVDGKLTENAVQFLTRAVISSTYRFLPQVSAGKTVYIDIQMRSER